MFYSILHKNRVLPNIYIYFYIFNIFYIIVY